MTQTVVLVAFSAVTAAALASVLACVPGLHVYNVMALLLLAAHALAAAGRPIPAEILVPAVTGLIVGYAMLNTIPSVLLAAPDESAVFTVLPGQKFLMAGRGYEGTMLTAAGGLAGVFIVLAAAMIAPKTVPLARRVLAPHMHWVLWCVITFMFMSEWPRAVLHEPSGWRRLARAWRGPAYGLFTFALSGLVGFILIFRSPISARSAFQNLMPAFVGLFALPWLILNIVATNRVPPQGVSLPAGIGPRVLLRGVLAGGLGGGFAAFFPVITGGVGGFLAGQATSVRDDRVFLVSQGTSKLVYYVGGFLLFFVPGARLTRGGGAWLISGLHTPGTRYDYYMMLASVALAGAASFLLLGPLARMVIAALRSWGLRRTSLGSLAIILAIVAGMTGLAGIVVTAVAAAIGLIPVLYGSRRMNCLGVILLPMACAMSGSGGAVAGWLGLL